ARDLEKRQQTERRRKTQSDEPDHAQHRHRDQRDSDPKSLHQMPGDQQLQNEGEGVYHQIELRKKRSARVPVLKLMAGDLRLLEVRKRCRDGVEEHKSADAEQIRRAYDVCNSGKNSTADWLFRSWVMPSASR